MAVSSIVFDVGQVLFAYNPEKVIDDILPNTPHKKEYLTHLFDAPIWHRLDRGDLSMEEALLELSPFVNHHPQQVEDMRTLIHHFALHLELIPESKDLFLALKKTHPVYILSNFQDRPFDQLLEAQPFMKEADGMVVSAKVKMAKPESEIYLHLLKEYGLDASTCLFIDDREENIEACRQVGMQGIVFHSPQQLERELLQLGLL